MGFEAKLWTFYKLYLLALYMFNCKVKILVNFDTEILLLGSTFAYKFW